jgi:hypothetical protein
MWQIIHVHKHVIKRELGVPSAGPKLPGGTLWCKSIVLTAILDGSEWQAQFSGCLYSGRKIPLYPLKKQTVSTSQQSRGKKNRTSRRRIEPAHSGDSVRKYLNASVHTNGQECYAAFIGSWLPTFRQSISVPSSRVKHFSSVSSVNVQIKFLHCWVRNWSLYGEAARWRPDTNNPRRHEIFRWPTRWGHIIKTAV